MTGQAGSIVARKLFGDRIIAVVRLSRERDGLPVARALCDGGVQSVEVTLTTPGATNLIHHICREVPEAFVGAGSVLTCEDVDRCLAAGAKFLVAPILDEHVLSYALGQDAFFCPGTFTPSEAHRAWALGAPLVKVFPAARLGPKYISDMKAPMPFLRLMPTGGITAETVGDFILAGADALGAGSWLTPRSAIESGNLGLIRQRAMQLRQAVSDAVSSAGEEGGVDHA